MEQLVRVYVSCGVWSEVFVKPDIVEPLHLVNDGLDRDPRVIYSCTRLNNFILKKSISFHSPKTAVSISYLGCWYIKIDIAHAYYNFRIHNNYKTKVGVCWNNHWFVFNVWPFGVCSIPLEFTTIMREIECFFYKIGITGISILDDWLFVCESYNSAVQLYVFLKSFFFQLGILLNDKKGSGPTQIIEWNGHKYNSLDGTICLRDKVILKINNEINGFHGICKVSIGYAQKLCGLLLCGHYVSRSVSSLIQHLAGQISVAQSNNSNSGILVNFNKLNYLKNLILKPARWQKLGKSGVVFVDASDYDCGVCFSDSVGWNYKFSDLGCSFHINNKELVAALIGLELSRLSGVEHALLIVDNTAVLGWLKKMSDVGSEWRSFILECWSFWWRLHGFSYEVSWIPSELNLADKWTRW